MRPPRRPHAQALPWRCLRGGAALGAALLVSGCAVWGWFGSLWPGGGATLGADFGYGPLPGQSLDLHGPPASGQSRPVLLFLHGATGSGPQRQVYASVGEALADYHLLVAVPDYGNEATTLAQRARAAAAAADWLRRQGAAHGADPELLFLLGAGDGAAVALEMLRLPAQSAAVAGVIALSMQAAGIAPQDPPRDPPPLLLLNGADDAVPFAVAQGLARLWRRAGGNVSHFSYPGADAGDLLKALRRPRFGPPVREDIAAFVRARAQEVKPRHPWMPGDQ